jgi:hypothetical protein
LHAIRRPFRSADRFRTEILRSRAQPDRKDAVRSSKT